MGSQACKAEDSEAADHANLKDSLGTKRPAVALKKEKGKAPKALKKEKVASHSKPLKKKPAASASSLKKAEASSLKKEGRKP